MPEETYSALLKIHRDTQLTPKEKIAHIDNIMRNLPQEVVVERFCSLESTIIEYR